MPEADLSAIANGHLEAPHTLRNGKTRDAAADHYRIRIG
jgi:hypothetical protein